MQGPEKNSYKEFGNEKKFLQVENSPPPPITFLMVRPLAWVLSLPVVVSTVSNHVQKLCDELMRKPFTNNISALRNY